MRQAFKDCLSQAQSQFLLAEILADKAKLAQIADTIDRYPITAAHAKLRDEIVAEREAKKVTPIVLRKPQESAGKYTTKTNGRGGSRQIVVSRKEEPKTYNGIDI